MTVLEINGSAGDSEVPGAEGERDFAVRARGSSAGVPDPELVEKPRRRRFTADYKLRIVREAEACTRPGEIGALQESGEGSHDDYNASRTALVA